MTGFEPFGGSSINPSEQVVRKLAETPPQGIDLYTAILPVERDRGPQALLGAIEQCAPQAVLCLGEASRRATLSIERVAVNLLDYRIPDNQGVQVVDEPVRQGGPSAYFVTLPVRGLLEAIQSAEVPVELSLSAGAYLCNQVLYTLLDHLALKELHIPAGFIHLPALPEQASQPKPPGASMSLETSLRGIRAAIEALAGGVPENPLDSRGRGLSPVELVQDVTIRRGIAQDTEALIKLRLALHREAGATFDADQEARIVAANRLYLQEMLPTGKFLSWVAEANGRLVACNGLIIYHRPPAPHNLATCEGYILNLYTRPEYRRRGVATALLKELLHYAREMGVRRVWLRSTPEGRLLYQEFGFQPLETAMELKFA